MLRDYLNCSCKRLYILAAEKDLKTSMIIAVKDTTYTAVIHSSPFVDVFLAFFTIYRYNITNSQHGHLPSGLKALLVEHCTGITEVMGLNPIQA